MENGDAKKTSKARDLSRREALGLMGSTAAAVALAGCGGGGEQTTGSAETTGAATTAGGATTETAVVETAPPAAPSCVVRPEQTEGPYFLDANLDRSDIREEREGVPLDLTFNVSRIDASSCAPISGALVNIWQCDASGAYSGFEDQNAGFDTREERFLRGYQTTDQNGTAQFTTIYPGWYQGRAVHIHFKIRTDPESEQGQEFTSQLYFDDALSEQVFSQGPYAEKGPNPQPNEEDGIFQREGGNELLLQLTEAGEGYAATFDIGLEMA